jgi:hypothetical protein
MDSIICPLCGKEGEAPTDFAEFSKPPEHEDDLNTVYKCRAMQEGEWAGCGFVFSPKDRADGLQSRS